jgi:hypothetical protein
LDVTDGNTVPDGGIDARIKWPSGIEHDLDLLKGGENILQFKSGKLTDRQIETEFKKPGVQKILKSGGAYLLCVGKDLVHNTAKARRAKLKELCRSRRIPSSRAQIVFGSGIARWVNKYPALQAFRVFGKQIPEYITVDRWRTDNPQLSYPFHSDKSRAETIEKIHKFLHGNTGSDVLRLEGPAGVGKTRLSLEAVKTSEWATRTVYAPNADGPDVTAFLASVYSNHQASAIAIIDECDQTRHSTLTQYAENSGGRLKLITVGIADVLHETPPLQLTEHYELKPFSDADIETIIRTAYSAATKEFIDATVRLSGGYVKLAMFVAGILDKKGPQPPMKIVKGREIRPILRKLVPENLWKSLQALSVLVRIGWEEELRKEAETVAAFINLPFATLESSVRQLKERGVVVPRGRYLYVSPDLLALEAAADLWDEKGTMLIKLIEALESAEPRRQLLRRLVSMSEHTEVRKAVQGILSKKGLFPSLTELDNPFLSEVFRILSSALPLEAVDLLTEHVVAALREDLLDFKTGRRDVVWALQSLQRRPETSMKAARVLMKLALSETEEISNNATAIFARFFQVFLSGSPVPLMDRFILIDELLASNDLESRMVAARAASGALKAHEFRMGGETDHLSKKPFPPEWRPKTYEEIWQPRRKALVYLRAIAGGNDEAAAFARKESLGSVFALLQQSQIEDAILLLESTIPNTDEERRSIFDSCRRILGLADISDAFRERVLKVSENAFGKTYFDRLRRWVGKRLRSDIDPTVLSGLDAADKKAFELAEEGFHHGIGDAELAWLSSPEAEHAWLFGKRLGELDAQESYFEPVAEAALDNVNCLLLAFYISGRGFSAGAQRREALIDRVAEHKPAAAFGATWRGEPTEAGAERIIRLIADERIPGSALTALSFEGWAERLPNPYPRKMVELMLSANADRNVETVLGIIDRAVRSGRKSIEEFGDAPWTALEIQTSVRSPNFDWHWGQVADLVAMNDPERFTHAFLKLFEADETWLSTDSAQQILRKVTTSNPKVVWNIIARELLREDSTGMRLRVKLEHWFGELIPPEVLVEWARSRGRKGFLMAAGLLAAKSPHLSDSVRMLVHESSNPKEIMSQVAADLISGPFAGRISDRMHRGVDTLQAWAQDPEPKIRDWARAALISAEKAVQRQKFLESEEDY